MSGDLLDRQGAGEQGTERCNVSRLDLFRRDGLPAEDEIPGGTGVVGQGAGKKPRTKAARTVVSRHMWVIMPAMRRLVILCSCK